MYSVFNRSSLRSIRAGVLALVLFLTASANAEENWISNDGLYRLSFSSELQPIVINRIHRWTLRLATSDGKPVTGAGIVVVGGMPNHDHGLPTNPRVTSDLGDGRYLLEGVRFHMNGYWEVTVSIDADRGSDTVLIQLNL